MLLRFLLIAGIALGALYIFFRAYKPFGGRIDSARRRAFQASSNFKHGRFVNTIPTDMHLTLQSIFSLLADQLRHSPGRRPRPPLTPDHPDPKALRNPAAAQLVWFGHSAFLVHIDGQTLLLDPMLGKAPSPFPALGPHRFSNTLPLTIDELPPIDAVLISHDHYDHLDYHAITKLKTKVGKFFVPLGVGVHLQAWGVPADCITELDWWEEVTSGSLQLACTPARHFSGRTLTDRFATLWCSWVIRSADTSLFFSGDTGYGPHFKDIGRAYGPFDLALLECGQYDVRWPYIHMQPEQTVQASRDLDTRRMLPIHWGAFVLALHDWTEPVERALAEAGKHQVELVTPRIGQVVALDGSPLPQTPWWRSLIKQR